MPLHLVKLSVGSASVDDLRAWIATRTAFNEAQGRGHVHDHVTRMVPRRKAELLDHGSVYWVIKGTILARQTILDLEEVTGSDHVKRCAIILDPALTLTSPQSRRAFQGWRYLKADDAPADMVKRSGKAAPPELLSELAVLGLL